MAYPTKVDPVLKTWVIAFDIKFDKLLKYAKANPTTYSDKDVNNYRVQLFNEIYSTLKPYGFEWRMQNSLVYNNSSDATKAFKAISLGLKKSWSKYFIEKLHIFEIDPNGDAIDLLEIDIPVPSVPDWLNNDIIAMLNSDDTSDDTSDEA